MDLLKDELSTDNQDSSGLLTQELNKRYKTNNINNNYVGGSALGSGIDLNKSDCPILPVGLPASAVQQPPVETMPRVWDTTRSPAEAIPRVWDTIRSPAETIPPVSDLARPPVE